MAFIPIDAKADVQGSKKGKLTPAQHAQLNAWSLASKTGILDALGRCEAESLTYTAINNVATIVFKKGYLVICGRLVECEAGTEVQVGTPANGSTSGKIIARYSLGQSQEKEFEVLTKQSGAPVQQDLNENPSTGVYEFELYSYTATPNLVILSRTGDYVPDIGGRLELFEKSLTDEGKPLGGYDTSKGTIEERLERLGFKEGSVTLSNGNATTNKIIRQGNYCILNIANIQNGDNKINQPPFDHKGGTMSINLKVGSVENSFLPREEALGFGYIKWYATYSSDIVRVIGVSVKITKQGDIYVVGAYFPDELTDIGAINKIHIKEVYVSSFGYEAQPL